MIIKDNVFVVTGAARGLGFAIAKDLATAGGKLAHRVIRCGLFFSIHGVLHQTKALFHGGQYQFVLVLEMAIGGGM